MNEQPENNQAQAGEHTSRDFTPDGANTWLCGFCGTWRTVKPDGIEGHWKVCDAFDPEFISPDR